MVVGGVDGFLSFLLLSYISRRGKQEEGEESVSVRKETRFSLGGEKIDAPVSREPKFSGASGEQREIIHLP